ncbi:MAG: hypothetical protein ACRDOH_18880 [Streptosporangiaceae bacterium]
MRFAFDVTGAAAAGDGIMRSVDELSGMLRGTAADVRVRPEPETWSVP